MKKISYLFVIGISIALNSCSTFSNVSKFYEPFNVSEDVWNVIKLQENEEPEIYSTDDIMNDTDEIKSDHYVCIGGTGFNGPFEDIQNDIRLKCKEIGATIALYSIDYTDTRYGSTYYQGTGGSYSIRHYDYTVFYLAKFTNDVGFGAVLMDIDNDTRQTYKRNTGAIVSLVYKNAPAYYANIVRGDIIIKINGKEILSANDGYSVINSLAIGSVVNMEVLRDGKSETISTTI